MTNYTHLRSQMIRLLELLRSILYPDVFDELEEEHTAADLETMSRQQLLEVLRRVYQEPPKYEDVADALFAKLPAIRETLETDIQAGYEGDPAATCPEEVMLAYPAFEAISIFRIAHELYLLKVPMLPRIMTEHAHSVTGIDINPGATIGRYFFIDHGTGIVVGETTVIGDHVKVYQGVTLGALTTRGGQSLRGKKRHPTIEDNVTIYAGASILGGGTVIGRDSVIGSNVFITHSIPPCTTVSVKSQELQFKPRNCEGNCASCTKPEPFWEGQK